MAEGNSLLENQEALMARSREAERLKEEGEREDNPDKILAGQSALHSLGEPARVQAEYDAVPISQKETPENNKGFWSKVKRFLRKDQTPQGVPQPTNTKAA